jgi:osmotically-inducible protein OsmY
MKHTHILVIAALLSSLYGCAAPVLVAGGAAAGATAADRRTTGTVVEDNAIELKAQEAIYTDDRLKKQVHVNVTSYNGIVLLTGEAPTTEMSDAVVSHVQQIPKVRQIHNEITIAPPSNLSDRSQDSWITTKVKAIHFGNKEVNGLNIKVVTEHRVVYLMGMVSQPEGDAATHLAREIEGVSQIVKMFEYQ